jgi:hypothetical protein
MNRDFACGMDAVVTNAYEVLPQAKLQGVKSTGCRFYTNSQNASLKLPKAILSRSRNRAIGQSGNRAIGQSGNRAIGQSGNRAIIHLS